MAGTTSGFDDQAFIDGIQFAMTMGAPPSTSDQVMFHFAPVPTGDAAMSADGVPFDPDVSRTSTTPDPVTVPCVVEYGDARDRDTAFGLQAGTRLRVTLLEADYRKVEDAAFVVYGGDRYDYRHTEAPVGLFSVGVWAMHFTAVSDQ